MKDVGILRNAEPLVPEAMQVEPCQRERSMFNVNGAHVDFPTLRISIYMLKLLESTSTYIRKTGEEENGDMDTVKTQIYSERVRTESVFHAFEWEISKRLKL